MKFLSEEWTEAVKAALNEDPEFRAAASGRSANLLQVVTADGGETRYWIKIQGGSIDMGLGDMEASDATITESYEIAVALAKSEISAVTAFMTGKIKVSGNMGLLLGLQGALVRLPVAMSKLDVEY